MAGALKLRPTLLSDFDDMKRRRLPNWGRWGRQGLVVRSAGASSIYERGGTDNRAGVDSEGEYSDTYDDTPRIDERDADNLDGYIKQLPAGHKRAICLAFYRLKAVPRFDLDSAVRAVLDLVEGNFAVNARMAGRV